MNITKEEFLDWKQHLVTQVLFGAINSMIREGQIEIAMSAGLDPLNDRYRAGVIEGLRTLLEVQPESETEF